MNLKLIGATFEQIKKAINGYKDPEPLLKAISQKLLNNFKLGIKKGQSPDGSKMAGISHRVGQPLRDTGRLQRSLTATVTNGKIIIGTNLKYAAIQQFGSTEEVKVPAHVKTITQAFGKPLKFPVHANVKSHTKKMNIKARPFIGFENRQKQIVNKLFTRWSNGDLH